ncbi:MAG: glucuronate isomerase [Pirellulales bacterium]|nr:glucuronate isomerase [Pirellulales bacterium]
MMADPAVFISENFLLDTPTAQRLFHDYARDLPIIDYHCHLPPKEIAEDHKFANITRIWLDGDHYKWRAMRTCGVAEQFITGDASDKERFFRWAETVPKLLRNPLYHWTHMELKRPFGIQDRLLSSDTAEEIWETCNEKLREPSFSCRGLLRQMNVELVCTTDDPVDSLDHHRLLSADSTTGFTVLPAWRPDRAMEVAAPNRFNAWVDALETSADVSINDFDSLLGALRKRHDYFHRMGCRLSDHGLEQIDAVDYTLTEVEQCYRRVREGQPLGGLEAAKFRSAMLYEFAVMDQEKDWTQQYHLGALRDCNSRMSPTLGYDSIGDFPQAAGLARLLDRLDANQQLGRTILYNVNPRDNAVVATMCGNFQDGVTKGKIQFGSAWWFLDQLDGMRQQLDCLSNMGVLSCFVGMLTDSRSFLSYPRHEYFRRLLCNILGEEIESGRVPRDFKLVGSMIQDICYRNAKQYFRFQQEAASHG